MSKQKFKHSSLTHFMRRNCDPAMVIRILVRCDVSPRVGCLPPQLVPLVRPENRAYVTDEFGKCLERFFINNKQNFVNPDSDVTFAAPDISALFNTECVIHARGVNICGLSPWSGGFGIVCKLSFPQIHADYALKISWHPVFVMGMVRGLKYRQHLRQIMLNHAIIVRYIWRH